MKRDVLAALALFAALTVIVTSPLAMHLGDAVEDGQDALLNVWILAWDAHALLSDPLRLFDTNIFVPFARTLAFSEINLSQALLAMPFTVASGNPVLGYNVALLLTFVLSGWGAYLLSYRLSGSRWGGLAAGIIFAFNAYKLSNLAQIQLLSLHWLPFALLFLDRLLAPAARRDRRRPCLDVAAAAAFLALQALASFYYAMFAALAAGLFVLCRLWGLGRLPDRGVLARLAIAAVMAGVVVMPFALPYFQVQRELGFSRSLADSEPFSASLELYAQALPGNLLYGKSLAPSEPSLIGGYPLDALFPGFFALGLAALGLAPALRQWRQAAFYPILVATAFVLSLGPSLYFARGQKLELPFSLPYAWLYDLVPGFGAFRAPERFSALVFLGLAVLAGLGVAALARRRAGLLAGAGVLLLGLECLTVPAAQVYAVPTGETVPPVYRWLAQQPTTTIIELPLGGQDAIRTLRYQYLSTYHWQRTPDGYSGFVPGAHGEMAYEMESFPSERSLALLRGYGVEYVVVHSDQMPQPLAALPPDMILEASFGPDLVYRLQPDPRPSGLALSVYLPEQAAPGAPYTAYLIARRAGQLPGVALPTAPVEVRATWSAQGSQRQQTSRARLPIVTSEASVAAVSLGVPSEGARTLSVEIDDSRFGQMVAQRSLVTGTSTAASLAFPVPARLVTITTDRSVYQPGDSVEVSLVWRALGKIDAYYSAFAALIGPDGRTLDRIDGEPQDGRRPTLLWRPGDEIADHYTLHLPAGAAPGRYQVEVGLYRSSDMAPALTLDEVVNPVSRLIASTIKIPLPTVKERPQTSVGARLGDSVTLVGFGHSLSGGNLDLTLYWHAEASMSTDYTVFVQALAADGLPAAQSDSQPVGGTYPTGIWSPGEVVADRRTLALPPGEYRIIAGMYDLATMRRLPTPGGDSIHLFDLKVP